MPKAITDDVKVELLAQLAEGQSLRSICRQDGMPGLRTVIGWLQDDGEFNRMYEQARQAGADALADEIRDLSQQAVEHPERAHAIRVAIDALRWLASKQNWRRYGDKIEQHVVTETKDPEAVLSRIEQLKEELGVGRSVH